MENSQEKLCFSSTSNYPEKKKERKREGGSGWGTHVNPWLIHVNVWQKPLQYCKVISLQLIKINEKERKKERKKVLVKEEIFQFVSGFLSPYCP